MIGANETEALRALLEAGWTRAAIAAELGLSRSTVTRRARALGFPDVAPPTSATDWRAVQTLYDAGHSIDECRARFGFSYAAWAKAARRGEIKSRPRADGQLARGTRDDIEDLLSRGLSQARIARELGLTKSTVAYHARRLGRRADPRYARRHDWIAVQLAIDDDGLSMTQCLERFGFGRDTWYRAVKRGAIVPRPHKIPLSELLVRGRRTNRTHLKLRLFEAGLRENRCERCGLTEWHGAPLSMHLHHRNGDGLDNRLENLELLCANCHSQTENWGGRGGRRRERPREL